MEQPNEGAVKVTGEFHFSPPTEFRGLTIDFFNEQAEIAAEKGLTHWATQTNKDEQPWVITLVFFTPEEL
jgi:hypothetical protein